MTLHSLLWFPAAGVFLLLVIYFFCLHQTFMVLFVNSFWKIVPVVPDLKNDVHYKNFFEFNSSIIWMSLVDSWIEIIYFTSII